MRIIFAEFQRKVIEQRGRRRDYLRKKVATRYEIFSFLFSRLSTTAKERKYFKLVDFRGRRESEKKIK